MGSVALVGGVATVYLSACHRLLLLLYIVALERHGHQYRQSRALRVESVSILFPPQRCMCHKLPRGCGPSPQAAR